MVNMPTDWKSRAPRPLPNTQTFMAQDSLPRLPVPELDTTLGKLERSVAALARDPQELNATKKKIQELGEVGGLGRKLQERLVAFREEPGRINWIEEFWDNAAYLTYRDSVVVNVSYYYGFIDPPKPQSAVERAASITRSALLFRRALKRGEVQPDRVKDGAHCMDTWRWMFDCCRVPALDGKDFSITHAKSGDDGNSGSVVFIRKGRVWKVDAVIDGELISTADLQKALKQIYEQTATTYPAVGYLPANNRDVWAKDYALLSESNRNKEILDVIESSAFVVSLDTETPVTPEDFSRAAWHGGVQGGEMGSRWVDKPVQFIVWDNAKAAIMGEHSVMDGTPTARMAGEVVEALKSPNFDHGSASSSAPAPKAYDWEMTPTLEASIAQAKQACLELVGSQTLNYLRTDYGKNAIKKMGYSPDSWTQMIIQLAYHRLVAKTQNGVRNGGTYEAATTRKFARGRTEAIRVTTLESEAWCKSMDAFASGSGSREDVQKAFSAAVKKHGQDAREAGNGQGIDRHLFGLKKMLQEGEQPPSLFSDPLFNRSSTWVLSTSAIHHPNFQVYGWGEVAPDGFGVPYVAGYDDFLQFTITSRTEVPNSEFIRELSQASTDMRSVIGGGAEEKPKL